MILLVPNTDDLRIVMQFESVLSYDASATNLLISRGRGHAPWAESLSWYKAAARRSRILTSFPNLLFSFIV